jgi:hypothetical protein
MVSNSCTTSLFKTSACCGRAYHIAASDTLTYASVRCCTTSATILAPCCCGYGRAGTTDGPNFGTSVPVVAPSSFVVPTLAVVVDAATVVFDVVFVVVVFVVAALQPKDASASASASARSQHRLGEGHCRLRRPSFQLYFGPAALASPVCCHALC